MAGDGDSHPPRVPAIITNGSVPAVIGGRAGRGTQRTAQRSKHSRCVCPKQAKPQQKDRVNTRFFSPSLLLDSARSSGSNSSLTTRTKWVSAAEGRGYTSERGAVDDWSDHRSDTSVGWMELEVLVDVSKCRAHRCSGSLRNQGRSQTSRAKERGEGEKRGRRGGGQS